MSTVIDYSSQTKPRLGERINFRMLTIILVFAFLVGFPVYRFVRAEISHGIEKNGDVYNVDLKSLGNFRFNDTTSTIEDVPAEYRKLDGKKVALEGFIWSSTGAGDKVNSFQFVYNIQKCCFGGPPLVQERVFAYTPSKEGVDYLPDEIRIIGTLHVNAKKDEVGKIETLYTLDVERTEPL